MPEVVKAKSEQPTERLMSSHHLVGCMAGACRPSPVRQKIRSVSDGADGVVLLLIASLKTLWHRVSGTVRDVFLVSSSRTIRETRSTWLRRSVVISDDRIPVSGRCERSSAASDSSIASGRCQQPLSSSAANSVRRTPGAKACARSGTGLYAPGPGPIPSPAVKRWPERQFETHRAARGTGRSSSGGPHQPTACLGTARPVPA